MCILTLLQLPFTFTLSSQTSHRSWIAFVSMSLLLSFFYCGVLELARSLLEPFKPRKLLFTTARPLVNLSALMCESHAAFVLWSECPLPAATEERAGDGRTGLGSGVN